MALKISTREVWAAALKDKPGALARALDELSGAGANLEFLIARRTEKRGAGVVFVTPIEGKEQAQAAKRAGFSPSESLFSVRVEATNQAGLGTRVARALADRKLNLRGFSGAAIGNRAVLYIALDNRKDAAVAVQTLKGLK